MTTLHPGLAALQARLYEDLERLCLPTPAWLSRADDDPALDVAIVGGGMAGLAAAAALRFIGVERVRVFDNVRLHFNSAVRQLAVADDGAIILTTAWASYALDHLIFATGYCTDLKLRPELAAFAPHIRWWCERDLSHQAGFSLHGFAETADDFSLIARDPAVCPTLAQVHLFTGAALMSQGKLVGDIPGVGYDATKLAEGIAARLYAADFAQQLRAVQAYDEREVQGDEWARIRVDPPRTAPAHPDHGIPYFPPGAHLDRHLDPTLANVGRSFG